MSPEMSKWSVYKYMFCVYTNKKNDYNLEIKCVMDVK